MAFVNGAGVTVQSTRRCVSERRGRLTMAAEGGMSRREMLSLMMGIGAMSVADVANAGVAFSKPGFNGATLKPGDVPVDADMLKSDDVQKKLKDLRELRGRVDTLASDFAANGQLDIPARVKSLVEVSVLRDDLNTVNQVFDEDTQIATDRVVRAVIQDLNELRSVGALKEGMTRSPKKITNTTGKITKLAADLDKLLQFYP